MGSTACSSSSLAAASPESLDVTLPVHRIGGEVVIGATDGSQSIDAAEGETVRLRVVNTERTPIRVTVSGAPFRVAAVDGRDLEGATDVERRSVRLGAGARADLVFTMPATGVRFRPTCPRHPSSPSRPWARPSTTCRVR